MDAPASRATGGLDEAKGLTFMRLLVWTKEPKSRMRLLAALVEACQGLRGGALASAIHSFVLQGNAALKAVVLKILVQVCRPLYEMLMLWTFEGELRDPYGEFFIGVNLAVDAGSLWSDKYYERFRILFPFNRLIFYANEILL